MASPGDLVKKISRVTGISEATVTSTHRYLRDHGLISKGGRGNSSAKMTCSDAANLLIALLAAVSINDSPDVVGRYGDLKLRAQGQLSAFCTIWSEDEPKTFAICVRNLLENVLSGEIARAVSAVRSDTLSNEDLDFNNTEIFIGIKRPKLEAAVRLTARVEDGDEVREMPILDLVFERSFVDRESGKLNIRPEISAAEMTAGLQECRWVGLEVVKAIAEIL